MPRGKRPEETPAKLEQNRLMWATFGKKAKVTIASWDPKQVQFTQALLEILTTGATVVLRPGSGGGSVGVAIWEGDFRHPPTWCYTSEELDEWSAAIMESVTPKGEDAAD